MLFHDRYRGNWWASERRWAVIYTVRFLAQWFADRLEEEVHLRISRKPHRLQPPLAALSDQAPPDNPPETNSAEEIE